MARTGRSTRPETNQPRPPEAAVITPRPTREKVSRLVRARWRTVSPPAVKASLHAATVPGSGCGSLQAASSLASCCGLNRKAAEGLSGRFAATRP
ncbi:MAG TPA: hypothetical protein VFV73_08620 [Streptosporangiaceae bacterium]|nr:hypothetical protein [Streptosporangiaceae bacterium]